jgi:hypothetical protein
VKYVDFSLELRQAEGARCRLMVRSPQGETESYFAVPDGVQSVFGRPSPGAVSRRGPGATLRLAATPSGSVVPYRDLHSPAIPPLDALEIGSRLHECLFRGRVAELFAETCAMAKVGGNGVRIRISALDASLSNIPWELLRSSKREYLCLSEHTPVVRSALVDKPVEPLRAELPLEPPHNNLTYWVVTVTCVR